MFEQLLQVLPQDLLKHLFDVLLYFIVYGTFQLGVDGVILQFRAVQNLIQHRVKVNLEYVVLLLDVRLDIFEVLALQELVPQFQIVNVRFCLKRSSNDMDKLQQFFG